MDRKRRIDSDSDSDLSAMGNPDLDLASSHSSDDDDDDDNFAWDAVNPQPQQSELSQHGTLRNACWFICEGLGMSLCQVV